MLNLDTQPITLDELAMTYAKVLVGVDRDENLKTLTIDIPVLASILGVSTRARDEFYDDNAHLVTGWCVTLWDLDRLVVSNSFKKATENYKLFWELASNYIDSATSYRKLKAEVERIHKQLSLTTTYMSVMGDSEVKEFYRSNCNQAITEAKRKSSMGMLHAMYFPDLVPLYGYKVE